MPKYCLVLKIGKFKINLKYFYFFPAAELNNIERDNKAFAQEFSDEEIDYGDSNDEDI